MYANNMIYIIIWFIWYIVDHAITIILIKEWLCLHLDDEISCRASIDIEIRKLRSRVTISHSWKSLVGKLDGTIRVPWESSRSRYTDLLLLNNSVLTSTTCLSTLPFAHRCFSPSAIRRISGWKTGERENRWKNTRSLNAWIQQSLHKERFSKIFPSLILRFSSRSEWFFFYFQVSQKLFS